jgi:hypothetical protein
MVEVPSSNLGSPTKHKKGPLNSGPFLCLVGYVRKEPLRQIAPAIWTTFRSPVGSKVALASFDHSLRQQFGRPLGRP